MEIPPVHSHPPAESASPPGPGGDEPRAWAAVILVVLVLGSASAMLFTGHDVNQALLLAGGVTLLGVAIARRILTDGGLLATIAIAGVVTAFAVVLLIRGYDLSDVAMVSGGAGLVAGEVTAWVLRTSTPRRGV